MSHATERMRERTQAGRDARLYERTAGVIHSRPIFPPLPSLFLRNLPLGGSGRAWREFKSDACRPLGQPGARRKGVPSSRMNLVNKSVFPVLEQLHHLRSLDGRCRMIFPETEITRARRIHGFLAEITHGRFENASAAFRTLTHRLPGL